MFDISFDYAKNQELLVFADCSIVDLVLGLCAKNRDRL
jgi:hypothetical protein